MKQSEFAYRNCLDKLRKVFRNPRISLFYFNIYIRNKWKINTPDIFIVSYPKCGRTWLRMILVRYFSLLYNNSEMDFFILEKMKGGNTIAFEHDQGSWVPAPPKLNKISLYKEKYRDKKVIFLARDPRDTLVSSWYHLTYRENIYKGSLPDFIRENLVGINKVIAYMNLWVKNKDVFDDFLLITYEDLKSDTEAAVKRILRFIGETEVDNKKLKEAIQFSSLKNMQQMETKGKYKIPWLKPGNSGDKRSFKTREGKVRGWMNHFSKEDVLFLNQKVANELSKEFPY